MMLTVKVALVCLISRVIFLIGCFNFAVPFNSPDLSTYVRRCVWGLLTTALVTCSATFLENISFRKKIFASPEAYQQRGSQHQDRQGYEHIDRAMEQKRLLDDIARLLSDLQKYIKEAAQDRQRAEESQNGEQLQIRAREAAEQEVRMLKETVDQAEKAAEGKRDGKRGELEIESRLEKWVSELRHAGEERGRHVTSLPTPPFDHCHRCHVRDSNCGCSFRDSFPEGRLKTKVLTVHLRKLLRGGAFHGLST